MENFPAPMVDKIPCPALPPLESSARLRRFRRSRTAQRGLSPGVFCRLDSRSENLLRPGLTNQTDLLSVSRVVLIELTPSQKGNAPGFEIIGRDVVACAGAFLHGRNIAVRASVKRSISTSERNITADCRALETGNIAQLIERLFC